MVTSGFQHAPIAFDSPFSVHAVLEATKIQIIHSAAVANDEASMSVAMGHLRTNVRLLRYMNLQKDENPYVSVYKIHHHHANASSSSDYYSHFACFSDSETSLQKWVTTKLPSISTRACKPKSRAQQTCIIS